MAVHERCRRFDTIIGGLRLSRLHDGDDSRSRAPAGRAETIASSDDLNIPNVEVHGSFSSVEQLRLDDLCETLLHDPVRPILH